MPTLAPCPLPATYSYRTPTLMRALSTNGLHCLRESNKNNDIHSVCIFVGFILNYFLMVVFKKKLSGLLTFLQRRGEGGEDEQQKWDGGWGKGRGCGIKESWDRKDERREREEWAKERDRPLHFCAPTNPLCSKPAVCSLDRGVPLPFPVKQDWEAHIRLLGSFTSQSVQICNHRHSCELWVFYSVSSQISVTRSLTHQNKITSNMEDMEMLT